MVQHLGRQFPISSMFLLLLHPYNLFFTLFCLSRLGLVIAHGFVNEVIIGDQSHPGWNPFVDPYNDNSQRVVRKVLNDGFVGTGDPDLACHHLGSDPAHLVADISAGSQITFKWAYWPGDHQGPISTYMTSCNGDCTVFRPEGARWFKIDEAGYDNGQWAAAILIANGLRWTSTIPTQLAQGEYLIRHEIIALHSVGTPQFYPSCTQVRVTGSGTGLPSDSDLVGIPALYNGVQFPDIYNGFSSFTVPGPPIVTFGNGQPAGSPQPQPQPQPAPANPTITVAPAPTGEQSINGSSYGSVDTPIPTPAVNVPAPITSGFCSLNARKVIRRRNLAKRHSHSHAH